MIVNVVIMVIMIVLMYRVVKFLFVGEFMCVVKKLKMGIRIFGSR